MTGDVAIVSGAFSSLSYNKYIREILLSTEASAGGVLWKKNS